MLTDGKILELFDATGGGFVGRLSRFARAIEAEVLQTQEPAGEIIMYAPYGKLSAPFARPEWHGGALPTVGTELYAVPQPPAPCQGVTDTEYYRAEFEKLQAKVAEQRAEIERLNRGMTVYTEAFEAECRTTDEQNMLIEMCEKALEHPEYTSQGLARRRAEALAAIASHKKGGSE